MKKQLDKRNQIQLYKEETDFWLDASWKTPREKRLEKQVEELKKRLEPLKVFENIPCNECGNPMEYFTRSQVLNVFKNWSHGKH